MSVCYQNGVEIEKLEISNLYGLSVLIGNNEYRLSVQKIIERPAWADIYSAWISPCIDFMWYCDHERKEKKAPRNEQERVARLYQEGAAAKDCDEFLKLFREMLTKPAYPNIGTGGVGDKIYDDMNQKLVEAAPYLRLRVMSVCLLANEAPEEFFSEGGGWVNMLLAPEIKKKYEAGTIAVKEGCAFEIKPDIALNPGGKLVAKTLVNKSGNICSIVIKCDNMEYCVKIPAHGILRAVFSDEKCTDMVSLKGCISCGDTQNAIIQKGSEKGAGAFYAYYNETVQVMAIPLPSPGLFWDVAADEADGIIGAVILGFNELHSTVNSKRDRQMGNDSPLPIRCYRSGKQWAELYEDGRLVGNLPGKAEMGGVTAVAEDAERGLLVCREGRFFDYCNNVGKEVSKENFVQVMLRRFLQAGQDECEVQETQFVRWAILESGEVSGSV